MKQQAPNNVSKIDNPPDSQLQVAIGQSKKPLATATLEFDIRDNTFANHVVVMNKLTGPIISLHIIRKNRVVFDTTHGLIHFPHLTMQVKTAASKVGAKPRSVLTDGDLAIPPRKTETFTAFVDHPSEWNTIGNVTLLEKFW